LFGYARTRVHCRDIRCLPFTLRRLRYLYRFAVAAVYRRTAPVCHACTLRTLVSRLLTLLRAVVFCGCPPFRGFSLRYHTVLTATAGLPAAPARFVRSFTLLRDVTYRCVLLFGFRSAPTYLLRGFLTVNYIMPFYLAVMIPFHTVLRYSPFWLPHVVHLSTPRILPPRLGSITGFTCFLRLHLILTVLLPLSAILVWLHYTTRLLPPHHPHCYPPFRFVAVTATRCVTYRLRSLFRYARHYVRCDSLPFYRCQ